MWNRITPGHVVVKFTTNDNVSKYFKMRNEMSTDRLSPEAKDFVKKHKSYKYEVIDIDDIVDTFIRTMNNEN